MSETTEQIVEAYVRSVRGLATIPNVRCAGQNEIDLIAIDPVSLDRYHIEVSISISQSFRKLTAKSYDPEKAKQRVHQASQRRTVGFFVEKKFGARGVLERLKDFGFEEGKYHRVIVTWGWEEEAKKQADVVGIELWDFREIVHEMAKKIRGSREYFGDDTLRTLNLFIHANDEVERKNAERKTASPVQTSHSTNSLESPVPFGNAGSGFWVYENWTHKYATVHRARCAFCNSGAGMHTSSTKDNGEWLGPFTTAAAALARAEGTKQRGIRRCSVCSPVD